MAEQHCNFNKFDMNSPIPHHIATRVIPEKVGEECVVDKGCQQCVVEDSGNIDDAQSWSLDTVKKEPTAHALDPVQHRQNANVVVKGDFGGQC